MKWLDLLWVLSVIIAGKIDQNCSNSETCRGAGLIKHDEDVQPGIPVTDLLSARQESRR